MRSASITSARGGAISTLPLRRSGSQTLLSDRRPRHQRRLLEDEADLALWRAGDVVGRGARPFDRARGRLAEPGDDAERRRLAAAGGAEQADELALARRRATCPSAPACRWRTSWRSSGAKPAACRAGSVRRRGRAAAVRATAGQASRKSSPYAFKKRARTGAGSRPPMSVARSLLHQLLAEALADVFGRVDLGQIEVGLDHAGARPSCRRSP